MKNLSQRNWGFISYWSETCQIFIGNLSHEVGQPLGQDAGSTGLPVIQGFAAWSLRALRSDSGLRPETRPTEAPIPELLPANSEIVEG